MGDNEIGDDKKWRQIAGEFDCHADVAVRRGAHRPMAHVQGFNRSHWMSPSGKCLHRIAPAAAMVNKFFETTQNTNKTQLLASNYSTFRALVISENFIPQCMNSFLTHMLSCDRWLCFFWGALRVPIVHDAAIWWCLRTGGRWGRSKAVITLNKSPTNE